MSHVRYIDKTREYYLSQGYATPYRWAHFDDEIPFTPLAKPLSRCRIGLVTTSEMVVVDEPEPQDADAQRARDVYALPTDLPVERLVSRKESYDRYATTLSDVNAYLPLAPLRAFRQEGRFADLAPRFQVLYSQYSQRKTLSVDAPEILRQMQEDRVDVALLTAV